MTSLEFSIRAGRREDAPVLAELVNDAGEGLPRYLWGKMADVGQDPWSIGQERAARESGSFSYLNATMITRDDLPVGALIGYEIPDHPEPISADMPAMFVPLQQLENMAAGTWYINVVAVVPRCRGIGLGSRLLDVAREKAVQLGKRGLSLIVSDANLGARRLYERLGYHEAGSRPMVKEDWAGEGRAWHLLVKTL